MQEKNFPRFVVTAIPVGAKLKNGEARLSGAGLYDSFALFAAPGSKLNDAAEHLFAHELFHYWNGRTLQAEDPERLVFWFTEGFTDYYSLRILHESGIWGPATYIAWINKHVREYFANSARNASNEDIQRDYWTQRDTVGEVAYQRGLLLGLRWNALAKAHGAKDGIDALFKPLVKRGKENGLKLSNPLIRQAGISTLGEWFGPEFDKYVQAAATIDLPADALAPDFTGRVETIYDFQLGFEREPSLKAQKVLGLVHGSKADAAGLKNGDELLAWNIPGDASQPVDLTIKRGREARKVTYYPQGKPHEVLQFHRSATSRPTTQASIHR
jgi:predicted metalloprotease with PDZ domain